MVAGRGATVSQVTLRNVGLPLCALFTTPPRNRVSLHHERVLMCLSHKCRLFLKLWALVGWQCGARVLSAAILRLSQDPVFFHGLSRISTHGHVCGKRFCATRLEPH